MLRSPATGTLSLRSPRHTLHFGYWRPASSQQNIEASTLPVVRLFMEGMGLGVYGFWSQQSNCDQCSI